MEDFGNLEFVCGRYEKWTFVGPVYSGRVSVLKISFQNNRFSFLLYRSARRAWDRPALRCTCHAFGTLWPHCRQHRVNDVTYLHTVPTCPWHIHIVKSFLPRACPPSSSSISPPSTAHTMVQTVSQASTRKAIIKPRYLNPLNSVLNLSSYFLRSPFALSHLPSQDVFYLDLSSRSSLHL